MGAYYYDRAEKICDGYHDIKKEKTVFFSVDKKCSSAGTVKRQGKILGQIEFVSIVKYVATETA